MTALKQLFNLSLKKAFATIPKVPRKVKQVGEDEEGEISMENYISYSEMQISALIAVSSPTFFINDGNRKNHGRIGKIGTYEEFGIYVGLVGARFEKPGFMEYQHIIGTEELTISQMVWTGCKR